MRYINLQAQLQAAGWSAQIVDSDTRRSDGYPMQCSHVYAVRGSERIFLCSFGRMWQMSRRKCAEIVAALPAERRVAS